MMVKKAGAMSRENAKPRPVENGTAGPAWAAGLQVLDEFIQEDGLEGGSGRRGVP